jgi:adenylate kinase
MHAKTKPQYGQAVGSGETPADFRNTTIQAVGISGSGKSFLLNAYFNTYNPRNFGLLEFGERLREKANKANREVHERDIHELVEEIVSGNKPLVITSHMVYRRDDGSYTWNLEFDKLIASPAYVYISAEPIQILQQITDDASLKGMLRRDSPTTRMAVEAIAEHQELSLKKTLEVCSLLRADLLIIHNDPSGLQQNMETLNAYFNVYIRATV